MIWRCRPPAFALFAALVAVSCGGAPEPTAGTETPPGGVPEPAPTSFPEMKPITADTVTGTAAMAARLSELADQLNPETNFYASEERVHHYRHKTPPTDPQERFRFDLSFARDLLQSGRTQESIEHYDRVHRILSQGDPEANKQALVGLRKLRGLAWLRLGEQENCLERHTIESCLLPIRGDGVHVKQRGSQTALREYLAALQEDPADLTTIWLMNVAFMTLGQYPDSVPRHWLIPPDLFESDYDIGRFRDASGPAGVDVLGLAGGSVMEDLDGDGYLDLMVSSWGFPDQMHFLRSNGDGTFTDRTTEAGLLGLTGGLNMEHADYDNDGDFDILVLRGAYLGHQGHFPNSLLRNDGNAVFEDVTVEAGLLDFHPTQAAGWADYDGDGWLDLLIGNETVDAASAGSRLIVKNAPGVTEDLNPCRLFRNNGDGTFTDVAPELGLDVRGIVKGAVWGDIDNDGRPDIYLSRMTQPNMMFHNDGPGPDGKWSFTDITERAGVNQPVFAFPTWFFDFDNDGWLDLFVSGYGLASPAGSATDVASDYLGVAAIASRLHLYRNNRDGTFTNAAPAMNVSRVALTMGANYGDLDNDGWLDFYLGTGEPDLRALYPNLMFRNAGGQGYHDVTTSGGFGHVQKGHGISFGDIDNDGDQDIHAVMGGAYSGDVYQNALFENPGHGNHWVTIKLEGVDANRSGVGARIRVTVEEGSATRDIHILAGNGGSFGSSPVRQEIGLGHATAIREIEIIWPGSGHRQVFAEVEMDRGWLARENADALEPLAMPTFPLPSGGGSHHHEAAATGS